MNFNSVDFNRLPDWVVLMEGAIHNISLPFGLERYILKDWLNKNQPNVMTDDMIALLASFSMNKTEIPTYTLENLIDNNNQLLISLTNQYIFRNPYITLKWLYYSRKIKNSNWLLLNSYSLKNRLLQFQSLYLEDLVSYDRSYIINNLKITESNLNTLKKSNNKYIFAKQTFNNKSITHRINEYELYAMAINLEYNFSDNPFKFVQNYLPSIEWTDDQINYVKNLDEDTKIYLYDYQNYSYNEINDNLREGLISEDDINLHNAIINSPLSNKQYIVFRVVDDISFIQEPTFLSKGFLSTTFEYNKAVNSVANELTQSNHLYLLKIIIPINIRGLYIEGSQEYEILFTYNITLKVIEKGYNKYYSTDLKGFIDLPTIHLIINQ